MVRGRMRRAMSGASIRRLERCSSALQCRREAVFPGSNRMVPTGFFAAAEAVARCALFADQEASPIETSNQADTELHRARTELCGGGSGALRALRPRGHDGS